MAKTPVPEDATAAESNSATPAGKGRATPSRKEQEASNKRPIVVADRKEARKRSREQDREERAKSQAGYAAGEERYLPQRDRGPQKKWVRDYVDARLSAGELLIPLMFVIIALLYFPSALAQTISTATMFGFFAVVILDSVFLAWRTQRAVNARWGARAERVRAYAIMRALQLRMMRLPKPQVKRFHFPD